MLKVTHTEHRIDAELYARIKAAFERHLGPDGARFLRPSRVDLLRKPQRDNTADHDPRDGVAVRREN